MTQAEKLRTIMAIDKLRDIDVASKLKISTNTVRKFLAGGEVRPLIHDAFDQFIRSRDAAIEGPDIPPAA